MVGTDIGRTAVCGRSARWRKILDELNQMTVRKSEFNDPEAYIVQPNHPLQVFAFEFFVKQDPQTKQVSIEVNGSVHVGYRSAYVVKAVDHGASGMLR
jgi:hypothetical protein